MSFVHGPLLWGLGLISVPLIIHLLNRRRFVVVRWATMEFLLAANKKNRRRVRLEQLLVLLLRMLAVALIVLAVSRPITSSGALLFLPGARDRVERVVLLDDSGSMAYREGRASAFERGRALLQRLVDDLRQERSGDVLSAWRGSRRQHDLLQAPLDSRVDDWLRQLGEQGPAQASWDPVSALKEVLAQLSQASDAPAQKVVYILTDLRARDWLGRDGLVPRALGEVILGAPEGTRFLVVDVGSPALGNLGLTVLTPAERLATVGVPLEVTIRIANRGDQPVVDVPLVLEAGQSRVPLPPVGRVPPGEEVEVRHRTTFERPGVHALSVQLPADGLPLDDRRWLALQVSERLKVLLVDGEPGDGGPLTDETDLLRLVLSPGEDVVTGVEPVVVSPERIPEDLTPFAAVIACNLDRWPPDRLQALERWVERGGGLGLFLGDRVDPAAWERDLWRQGQGLLPCALGERLEAETLEAAPAVLPTEEQHPLTEVFRGDKNPFLRRLRGRIRRACPVDEKLDQGTRVLLRWADGERSPFLLEKDRGKGRVVMFNTTADLAWSPWPKDPSFLITAQELVRLLAPPATAGRNLALMEPLERGINPARFEPLAGLHLPGEEQPRQLHAVPRTGSDALWFSFAETARAGLVRLEMRPRQGAEPHSEVWAVNVDPSEGETARADPGRIQPALEGAQVKFLSAGAEESLLRATDGSRTELWRSALVALLVALALEQVLAWRAAHHAPPGQASAPSSEPAPSQPAGVTA